MPSPEYRQTSAPKPVDGLFVELWDPTLTTNTLARVERVDASSVSFRVWNPIIQKPGKQVFTISRQAWTRRARPHNLRLFGPSQFDWARHEPESRPNVSPPRPFPPLTRVGRRVEENGTTLVMGILGGALAVGYVREIHRALVAAR